MYLLWMEQNLVLETMEDMAQSKIRTSSYAVKWV